MNRCCRLCGSMLPLQPIGRPRLYCDAHGGDAARWRAGHLEYVANYIDPIDEAEVAPRHLTLRLTGLEGAGVETLVQEIERKLGKR